jgi:hypothetical protein
METDPVPAVPPWHWVHLFSFGAPVLDATGLFELPITTLMPATNIKKHTLKIPAFWKAFNFPILLPYSVFNTVFRWESLKRGTNSLNKNPMARKTSPEKKTPTASQGKHTDFPMNYM